MGAQQHIEAILRALRERVGYAVTPAAMDALQQAVAAEREADARELVRLRLCEQAMDEVLSLLMAHRVPAGPLRWRLETALVKNGWVTPWGEEVSS